MIVPREQTIEAGTLPTVFVVEDDVSVRESVELLVLGAGWRVELFETARDFLAHPMVDTPRCLVLDMGLPGLNGLDLQESLTGHQEMPIIFITGSGDISMTVRAMKAGAFEYLAKPLDSNILLKAIERAIEFSRAALSRQAELRELEEMYASLTVREREVMGSVVAGLLNKQIAAKLGITEITVKAHRGKLMRKMNADSLASLVRLEARLRV
jgi:FixJ family two-component response regulator